MKSNFKLVLTYTLMTILACVVIVGSQGIQSYATNSVSLF